jgi:hypothetical protein
MPPFSPLDDYEVHMTTFNTTAPKKREGRVRSKALEYVTPSGEAFDNSPAYRNKRSQAWPI